MGIMVTFPERRTYKDMQDILKEIRLNISEELLKSEE